MESLFVMFWGENWKKKVFYPEPSVSKLSHENMIPRKISSMEILFHPWIKCHPWKKMMDDLFICGCHQWIKCTNKDDG